MVETYRGILTSQSPLQHKLQGALPTWRNPRIHIFKPCCLFQPSICNHGFAGRAHVLMNTDGCTAVPAYPSLGLRIHESVYTILFDRFKVLKHAHMILARIARIQILQPSTGVCFAIIAETGCIALDGRAVFDNAAHTVYGFRAVLAMASAAAFDLSLVCAAKAAVHAARGNHGTIHWLHHRSAFPSACAVLSVMRPDMRYMSARSTPKHHAATLWQARRPENPSLVHGAPVACHYAGCAAPRFPATQTTRPSTPRLPARDPRTMAQEPLPVLLFNVCMAHARTGRRIFTTRAACRHRTQEGSIHCGFVGT